MLDVLCVYFIIRTKKQSVSSMRSEVAILLSNGGCMNEIVLRWSKSKKIHFHSQNKKTIKSNKQIKIQKIYNKTKPNMQFTSNIIVALLLAVSTTTVTAAQKFANLRGGVPSQVSTQPSVTASPSAFPSTTAVPSVLTSQSPSDSSSVMTSFSIAPTSSVIDEPTPAPSTSSSKPSLELSEVPSAFPSTTAAPSVLTSQSPSDSSSVMPSFSIAPTSSVSDESTSATSTSPSGLSSIINDAANPPLPNLERSLADAQFDGCPGLDLPKPNTGEGAPGCVELSCPGKTKCYSWIHEDCYCN